MSDNLNTTQVIDSTQVAAPVYVQQPQVQIEQVPQVIEHLKPEPELPEDVKKLSTGVLVRFKKLDATRARDLMVKTFTSTNMDSKGNLNTDKLSTTQQIALARNVTEYHTALIDNGVELVGNREDYYNELNITSTWVKRLRRSGLLDVELYDFEDETDLDVLFLRYQAFQSEDDWQLLSSELIG